MSSLADKLLTALRGRHNSIRYRFVVIPKDYLFLLTSKLLGRSWIDFYAKRIDNHQSELIVSDNCYLSVGNEFLTLLKSEGLDPGHRLLDYGCGILRGGLQFVPYLNPGGYVGVDISKARLEQGDVLMKAAGIDRERYETMLVRDCRLRELEEQQFDYVWAHAVLMHMPLDDIKIFLGSLRAHLKNDGKFYSTYFASENIGKEKIVRDQIRDFYYPTELLKSVFSEFGFSFEILPGDYRENWGVRVRSRKIEAQ